jgi:hypothetical protein
MRLEEMRKFVTDMSAAAEGPFITDLAIQQAIHEADEIVSGRGGAMGREFVLLDITTGRDIYPLPTAFIRIQKVERVDGASPWALSPVPAAYFTEVARRPSRGGFWAPLSHDKIQIAPTPTSDEAAGLRVWGYPKREFEVSGDENQDIALIAGGEYYVLWRACLTLASDQRMASRAERELGRAELTLRKLVEKPHVDTPPSIIREMP